MWHLAMSKSLHCAYLLSFGCIWMLSISVMSPLSVWLLQSQRKLQKPVWIRNLHFMVLSEKNCLFFQKIFPEQTQCEAKRNDSDWHAEAFMLLWYRRMMFWGSHPNLQVKNVASNLPKNLLIQSWPDLASSPRKCFIFYAIPQQLLDSYCERVPKQGLMFLPV